MYLPGVIGVSTIVAICVDAISGTCVVKFWKAVDKSKEGKTKQGNREYSTLRRRCQIK